MASRCCSISLPALSFLNSAARRSIAPLSPIPSPHRPPLLLRAASGPGALQSLLPLHSAVSSAQLTSRLGVGSAGGARSLSQDTLCCSNPGV